MNLAKFTEFWQLNTFSFDNAIIKWLISYLVYHAISEQSQNLCNFAFKVSEVAVGSMWNSSDILEAGSSFSVDSNSC